MEVTEVRVRLPRTSRQGRVLAFCSITFDNSFVVRDVRIIEGAKGAFVAMPTRKLSMRCPRCGRRNSMDSNYCLMCGSRLYRARLPIDPVTKKPRLHVDVAHPINSELREKIEKAALDAYHRELEVAKSTAPTAPRNLEQPQKPPTSYQQQ